MLGPIIKNIENATDGKVAVELTFVWTRRTEEDELEYRYRFTELDLKDFDINSLASLFGGKVTEALKSYIKEL